METDYAMREKAVGLGRGGVPLAHIVKQTGIGRAKLIQWFESEGIEPVMLRGDHGPRRQGGSVRNTPLALSIEDGVRRRVEEQNRQEEAEARKRGRVKK